MALADGDVLEGGDITHQERVGSKSSHPSSKTGKPVRDDVIADGFSMPHSPRIWGDFLYVLESERGYLVRIDRRSGKREDLTFCPDFARGMAFVSHYAVVTVSLPRHANFGGLPIDAAMKASGAAPRCGLLVIDLRNGDIVQWFRFRGDITELFDVGVIPNVRCPRGIGPYAPGLEEVMRGEELAAGSLSLLIG